jgi:hypothetical protein
MQETQKTADALLVVAVGADNHEIGRYTLTTRGIRLSGSRASLRALMVFYRKRFDSDQAFMEALPHLMNGRGWAAFMPLGTAEQEN